jgi:hypothetical protein
MTNNLFNFKFENSQAPISKEDIRVLRILWFSIGFITALIFLLIKAA